jgi:hypothetical protein
LLSLIYCKSGNMHSVYLGIMSLFYNIIYNYW